MKKTFLLIIVLFLILGCGEDKGKIRVLLIDAPPPQNVQNIYITVLGVAAKNMDDEIITLQEDFYLVDIVRLTGGKSTSLTYNYRTGGDFLDIENGDYKSILLALAQINSVVIDSTADTLLIPSEYTPFIFELETDFTIFSGEYNTIIVDFDASKSINWESTPYQLNPTFRIFEYSEAGFIQGAVTTIEDTLEEPVKFAVLSAVSSTDTITTLSDSTGSYSLFIREGTYNISAYAEGFSVDTVYEGIIVDSDSVLTGYDFLLTEEFF